MLVLQIGSDWFHTFFITFFDRSTCSCLKLLLLIFLVVFFVYYSVEVGGLLRDLQNTPQPV